MYVRNRVQYNIFIVLPGILWISFLNGVVSLLSRTFVRFLRANFHLELVMIASATSLHIDKISDSLILANSF